MTDTAPRTAVRARGRKAVPVPSGGRRHPLVATAMVLPLAALLVVVFGGWEAVVTQASSVGVMLGR
ncbi:hypothetical protein M4914_02875 [Streptomyces somaliensis DSM 40738]|uniref:Uncharacterized protein n=1 Tax=Streptomyces somaliensis (strain ATCC 33201 / DSM 40738 / JCM 12659 / KCTC 9044 / NCTC 11332 / NRRL B-12077 / IP 733) TaxID=1134445 RepID=A0AA44DH03_STRE0|nr:hypothetical protein [Streptomyces somaliensis]MCQ0022002.1 hypothetical protein [Streptomyces somaliensis DSM 40738]NKY15956.1 hypothetical protein [Streptomyces somaliensis DSM 40738]